MMAHAERTPHDRPTVNSNKLNLYRLTDRRPMFMNRSMRNECSARHAYRIVTSPLTGFVIVATGYITAGRLVCLYSVNFSAACTLQLFGLM